MFSFLVIISVTVCMSSFLETILPFLWYEVSFWVSFSEIVCVLLWVTIYVIECVCVCFGFFFLGGEGFVPHFFDRIFFMSHHFCDMMFSFSTVIVCVPSSVTISVMCSYLIDFFSNITFCVLVTSSVIGCVPFWGVWQFIWLDVFFWG